ncbi:MAG: hypothetical protein RLO46_13740 [Pseudomonadales bacterium]
MMHRLIVELRRRKVLRVASAYVVVSWGVLQVADWLFPVLGMPDWTVTFVALVLLLGLPVCLVITWAFHLTPDGIRPTPPLEDAAGSGAAGAEPAYLRWLEPALLVGVLALVGVSSAQMLMRTAQEPPADAADARTIVPSVAVLPFTSFSSDAEDNYFADGLTEELINGLVQVPGLQVPGRTSSFYFKNRNEDLREIAHQLGVAHVVEGSVRRSGERLRVTVQLVSASDGFHLWSQTYDRHLDDAFAIQQDISVHVAASLKRTLLTDHTSHVEPGLESASYPKYLVATALLRQRDLHSVTQARALFDEILAAEPDHVDALAGSARATILLAGAFLAVDYEPAAAAAVAAAERALALAPDSVAANVAAGSVYGNLAFRTDEQHYLPLAERALARAANLAPNDPEALVAYASLLTQFERWEPALTLLQRAVAHDPLDRSARFLLAGALSGVGRQREAEAELVALLARFPDFPAARMELGEVRIASGDLVGAVAPLQAANASRTLPRATFALANVYINLGDTDRARSVLRELDYAPLSMPLAGLIAHNLDGDAAAALRLARSELARTGDRIWRPVVALLALVVGDLATAREQIAQLDPSALGPQPDVTRLAPMTALLAGNLMFRDGQEAQARALIEGLLVRLAPSPDRHDAAASKVLRSHALAQLGRRDEALGELAAARAQGYRTIWDFDNFLPILRYPAFAALRDDADIQALVGAVLAENAAAARALPAPGTEVSVR